MCFLKEDGCCGGPDADCFKTPPPKDFDSVYYDRELPQEEIKAFWEKEKENNARD